MSKPVSKHALRETQTFISAIIHGKLNYTDDSNRRVYICKICNSSFDLCRCRKDQ